MISYNQGVEDCLAICRHQSGPAFVFVPRMEKLIRDTRKPLVVVDPKKVKAEADAEWATMLTDFAAAQSDRWFQPE